MMAGPINFNSLKRIIANATTPYPSAQKTSGQACVFLLLYNKDAEVYFLAIQKSDTHGYPWRNQVALPGGHIEKYDASPLDAALRELEEELAISRQYVEFIGSLGHFQTVIKPRDIEVFVGWWNGQQPIQYDAAEICRVLEIPLTHIIQIHLQNGYRDLQAGAKEFSYPFEDVIIWGASARILHRFIEVIYPFIARIHPNQNGQFSISR